jgi:hypothetical protein
MKFDRGGTTRPKASVERTLAASKRPVCELLRLQGLPSDLLDEPAAGALVERVRAAAAELSSLLDHQAPAAEGRVVPLRRGAA